MTSDSEREDERGDSSWNSQYKHGSSSSSSGEDEAAMKKERKAKAKSRFGKRDNKRKHNRLVCFYDTTNGSSGESSDSDNSDSIDEKLREEALKIIAERQKQEPHTQELAAASASMREDERGDSNQSNQYEAAMKEERTKAKAKSRIGKRDNPSPLTAAAARITTSQFDENDCTSSLVIKPNYVSSGAIANFGRKARPTLPGDSWTLDQYHGNMTTEELFGWFEATFAVPYPLRLLRFDILNAATKQIAQIPPFTELLGNGTPGGVALFTVQAMALRNKAWKSQAIYHIAAAEDRYKFLEYFQRFQEICFKNSDNQHLNELIKSMGSLAQLLMGDYCQGTSHLENTEGLKATTALEKQLKALEAGDCNKEKHGRATSDSSLNRYQLRSLMQKISTLQQKCKKLQQQKDEDHKILLDLFEKKGLEIEALWQEKDQEIESLRDYKDREIESLILEKDVEIETLRLEKDREIEALREEKEEKDIEIEALREEKDREIESLRQELAAMSALDVNDVMPRTYSHSASNSAAAKRSANHPQQPGEATSRNNRAIDPDGKKAA